MKVLGMTSFQEVIPKIIFEMQGAVVCFSDLFMKSAKI